MMEIQVIKNADERLTVSMARHIKEKIRDIVDESKSPLYIDSKIVRSCRQF